MSAVWSQLVYIIHIQWSQLVYIVETPTATFFSNHKQKYMTTHSLSFESEQNLEH